MLSKADVADFAASSTSFLGRRPFHGRRAVRAGQANERLPRITTGRAQARDSRVLGADRPVRDDHLGAIPTAVLSAAVQPLCRLRRTSFRRPSRQRGEGGQPKRPAYPPTFRWRYFCPTGREVGGELVVEDLYGAHEIRLPAGDLILSPASSLPHGHPGHTRHACGVFFWLQSIVRDARARGLILISIPRFRRW